MSEWKTYKLGELVEKITKGTTPSTLGGGFVDSGINFIKSEAVGYDGRIDQSTFVFITEGTNEKLKRSQLQEGDILFSMAGIFLGKNAIVTKDILPANTNQALAIIRLKKETTTPSFVHYFLRQKDVVKKINSMSGQSAQPNINFEEIKSIEINLPDAQTQTQIAQILTSLDDKIELNLQMNQTLEAMAQALFKEWFVNFNFPNFDGELENGLPKGWRMGIFEELTDIKTGKGLKRTEFNPDGIYPIIGANGELGRTDEYLLDDKLLLTGRVGTLGSIKISYGKKWYSDNVLIMKPYKYFYFTYFNLKAIDMNSLNRGSTQPLVTQTDLKNYLTLIPSNEIVLLFEKTVNEIFEKIFFNDIQIQTLTQTRDTLLPKLMSGKIEIKN